MKTLSKEFMEKNLVRDPSTGKARKGIHAQRRKNGYNVEVEFDDGSLLLERYNGKHEKVSSRRIPAPPSKEVRVKVPVKTLAKIKKLASASGMTERGLIRKLIEQEATRG